MREYLETRGQIGVLTRWNEVKTSMKRDETLRSELSVRELNMLDILTVFEDVVKGAEKKFFEDRKQKRREEQAVERRKRQAFLGLLGSLVKAGRIRHDSRWQDVYTDFEDDERYIDMVGQAGSTPLELFWDEVEQLKKELRIKRDIVLDGLAEIQFEFTETTSYDEFKKAVAKHALAAQVEEDTLKYVYERQLARAQRHAEEDRHAEERRARRRVDALRSVLRHLEPAMTADSTWAEIRERIKDTEEFAAVEEESEREAAFERQLARVKEDAARERKRR